MVTNNYTLLLLCKVYYQTALYIITTLARKTIPPLSHISLHQQKQKIKIRGHSLTMLMGSTGPILLTYTAVSITVGLTETTEDMLY